MSPPPSLHVLLVEDNRKLADSIAAGLRDDEMNTEVTASGVEALARLRRGDLDVAILDLGLPDLDGMEVLAQARAGGARCPILVLTARDSVATRVAALSAGADDFLIKPFAFDELVARIRALARRATGPRWHPATAGGVTLDDDLHVRFGSRQVALTPREHSLLGYLLRRRGEVALRTEILRDVFGYTFDPGTNSIDVHVTHLRHKLVDLPIAIETIRGAGFRLTVAGT